jgi:hypothetical protein
LQKLADGVRPREARLAIVRSGKRGPSELALTKALVTRNHIKTRAAAAKLRSFVGDLRRVSVNGRHPGPGEPCTFHEGVVNTVFGLASCVSPVVKAIRGHGERRQGCPWYCSKATQAGKTTP